MTKVGEGEEIIDGRVQELDGDIVTAALSFIDLSYITIFILRSKFQQHIRFSIIIQNAI